MSLLGRQLGDFLLEKKLGQGGMGEVYKARQTSLDRIVAVKILPKSLAANEGFEERFRREARAAANLIHPNVIQVYHIGVDEELGTPYFAMEYVEGEDLQQRLKRTGRLPFEQSVEILAGVAAALSVAYERGIVHRDIKPSNIMIDRNEIVKVMDFGLAKATQDKASSNLTQSGLIMGTPNYISPEAGRGDPIDARSDIYSLGVVFYELLTGQLPFTAGTPAAIIYKHVYEPPKPLHEIAPDVPPFLAEICLRMIQKEPKDRYPAPKALLADLNEFKRNSAHYLAGGARKTPVIGTGSVAGDQTLGASGSFPGKAGPGSRDNEQTMTFREGQTQPEGQTLVGGRSGVGAPGMQGSSGGITGAGNVTANYTQAGMAPPRQFPTALVVVAMLAVGVTGFVVLGPLIRPPGGGGGAGGGGGGGGGGSVAKVIVPWSKLKPILPKGTEVLVLSGITPQPLFLADIPFEPGPYALIFRRKHYEDVQVTVQVSPEGVVSPPIESLKVEFSPSDAAQALVRQARRDLEEHRYREVLETLQTLKEQAPDYDEVQKLYAQAELKKKSLEELSTKGQKAFNERNYEEAIRIWKDVPQGSRTYEDVQRYSKEAQSKIDTVVKARENFQKFFQAGDFMAAQSQIADVDNYTPPDRGEGKALRDKLDRAQRDLEKGKNELANQNLTEAIQALEALIRVAPSHKEGLDLLNQAKSRLASQVSKGEALRMALDSGEKAYAEGRYEEALQDARRALDADPGSQAAKGLRERATVRIAEAQVVARLGELDAVFLTLSTGSREKKTYALLQMIDPGTPAAAAVKADAEALAFATIRIDEAKHRDFAFEMKGEPEPTEAVVECNWDVTLVFPDTIGAEPPAKGTKTALTVRQKIACKRAGQSWLFTSFEQIGKANVR